MQGLSGQQITWGPQLKQESIQKNVKVLLTKQEAKWQKRHFSDISTDKWTLTMNLAKAGAGR